MFLRYTPATRADLGFNVQRATFELDLLALLDFAYERRDFCGYVKDVPGQDPPAEELAAAWTPTIQALELLVENTDQGNSSDPPEGHHGLEDCIGPMVAEHKYRAVHCPACAKTYEASSVKEEDFGYEERVVGGQRYVCPETHVLFVFIRFDTRT